MIKDFKDHLEENKQMMESDSPSMRAAGHARQKEVWQWVAYLALLALAVVILS